MKLLVFLAKGFETIEFSAFIDVMGWAKTDFDCKIDVVTCGLNQKVISSFNVPVLVDKVIEYNEVARILIRLQMNICNDGLFRSAGVFIDCFLNSFFYGRQ
jgi:hypothetical protein